MKSTAILVLSAAAAARLYIQAAEEVTMKAEKAVVITFPSQPSRTYKVLGAETADGPWRSLQDGITGTGGEVTVFYKSESDQKLFFKVEGREGTPAQQSLLAMARLDLSKQNLNGIQLPGHDLELFTLSGASFANANLAGANLSSVVASETSFRGADLRGIVTDGGTSFGGASFNGANLEGTRLWARLANTDFRNARLNGASFVFSSLRGA